MWRRFILNDEENVYSFGSVPVVVLHRVDVVLTSLRHRGFGWRQRRRWSLGPSTCPCGQGSRLPVFIRFGLHSGDRRVQLGILSFTPSHPTVVRLEVTHGEFWTDLYQYPFVPSNRPRICYLCKEENKIKDSRTRCGPITNHLRNNVNLGCCLDVTPIAIGVRRRFLWLQVSLIHCSGVDGVKFWTQERWSPYSLSILVFPIRSILWDFIYERNKSRKVQFFFFSF